MAELNSLNDMIRQAKADLAKEKRSCKGRICPYSFCPHDGAPGGGSGRDIIPPRVRSFELLDDDIIDL